MNDGEMLLLIIMHRDTTVFSVSFHQEVLIPSVIVNIKLMAFIESSIPVSVGKEVPLTVV